MFAELVPEDEPIVGAPGVPIETEGLAAWGRPLVQSTTALIPFLEDDDATLDADPTGGAAPSPDDGGTS